MAETQSEKESASFPGTEHVDNLNVEVLIWSSAKCGLCCKFSGSLQHPLR